MNIHELQHEWDRFGQEDPLWAILTRSGMRGGRWDQEEFFATGRADITAALKELDQLECTPERGRALDFGAGVGRLTQALARHFSRVDGVDIAPSMVERARQFNQWPERCFYHLNTQPDLSCFETGLFDLVYSRITLQHMEQRYAFAYIREFVRVLRPGGVLVFQLPARPRTLWLRVHCALPRWVRTVALRRAHPGKPVMEMYSTPRRRVERVLRQAGAVVHAVLPDHGGGPDWPGFRFIASKPASA